MSALSTQIGGGHYKKKGIQPVEYIHANRLNFFEGNIVKYITRWRDKGGVEDIDKVIHYAEMLKELECSQQKTSQVPPKTSTLTWLRNTIPTWFRGAWRTLTRTS